MGALDRKLRALLATITEPASAGWFTQILVQCAAFLLSMLVLLAILSLLGYGFGPVLSTLWSSSVGSKVAIGLTLTEATPLALTGVAVWLAARAGMFNIGADGQLQLGGVAAFVIATHLGLPGSGLVLIPLALIGAALVGGAWGAIAGLLKGFRGANEVISTLMLNYIAFIAVNQLIQGPLKAKGLVYTPQTPAIPVAAEISPLVSGTEITWAIIVAVVIALATVMFVQRTRLGLRLRAVGLNSEAARIAGLRPRRYWISALTVSGALSGLAGGLVVLGVRYYLAPGWAEEWGYEGILIAFVAFRTPYLIPFWALLFGMLSAAGPTLEANVSVPSATISIMQTLPVITLFLLYSVGRRWQRTRQVEPPEVRPSSEPSAPDQQGRDTASSTSAVVP